MMADIVLNYLQEYVTCCPSMLLDFWIMDMIRDCTTPFVNQRDSPHYHYHAYQSEQRYDARICSLWYLYTFAIVLSYFFVPMYDFSLICIGA